MPGIDFSVACPNDLESLEEVFALKKTGGNRIREIYLAGPQQYCGAGRILSEEITMGRFVEMVNTIHAAGLRVNLIMNSTCEGDEWYTPGVVEAALKYIKLAHEKHGVEAVTLANPFYIKGVRKYLPDIEICASVLSDIDSVQRAVIYSRAGADVITPDVNINRNLKLLKDIKEIAGVELKLLVNEGCLYRCPFRKFHFNYISHRSKEPGRFKGESAFVLGCLDEYERDRSQIIKSCWIRPEDIGKYSEITNYFKIVGRASPKNIGVTILRYMQAYMNESWNGNLMDILNASIHNYSRKKKLFLDNKALTRCGFFDKVTTCGYDCLNCSYCNELAARLISFGQ